MKTGGPNIFKSITSFLKSIFIKDIDESFVGKMLVIDEEEVKASSMISTTKNKLKLGTRSQKTFEIQRARTSSGAGVDLDIKAGNGFGTDKVGGDLNLYGGASTGTVNGGKIRFWQGQRSGSSGSTLNDWEEMFNTEITQSRINFLGLNTLYFPGKDAKIQTDQSIELILDADNDDTNRYLAIKDSAIVRALFPDEGNLYLMSASNFTGLFLDAINSRISAGSKAAHSGENANTDNTGAANQAGVNLTIAGGAGTGNGNGGGISFGTFPGGSSGVSANSTYEEKMAMDRDGNLQIDGSLEITAGRGISIDGNTITGIDDSGEFTNDDAHIMTSAAVEDKIQTHSSYQYISFTGNATVPSDGDWMTISANGISNHTWNVNLGSGGTSVGSSTVTIPTGNICQGIIVPYDCVLVGYSSIIRSVGNHQSKVGLAVGVPTYNDFATFDCTLRAYNAADISAGPDSNYSQRPVRADYLIANHSMSAGHVIFPLIGSVASNSRTVQWNCTLVLKTLIP